MANLIVEDMSGQVSGANTYVGLDTFKDFCASRGIDVANRTDDELAIFLIKSCDFLNSYEYAFKGNRLKKEQSMAFPRVVTDCSGDTHLPTQLLTLAVCHCAELINSNLSLFPLQVSKDDYVTKEKVSVLETQYSADIGKYMSKQGIHKMPIVANLMNDYFKGFNQYNVGR